MTKGIILMCFGDQAYAKMAFNMALSIKCTSEYDITLVHDGQGIWQIPPSFHFVFDTMIEIDREDIYEVNGVFSPGKAKTRINKYLQYDYNIYLDVDGCVVKDLGPLFDTCIESKGCYKSQVVGHHTIDKGRDFIQMQWAWADQIWPKYGLTEKSVMPAINSSFAFLKRGKELDALYKQIQSNIDDPIPIPELRTQWGKTQPDELYTNIALGQLGIDALLTFEDGSWNHPIYFNVNFVKEISIIPQNHYILGLYGGVGFTHKCLMDYYDRLMRVYCREKGFEHHFKAHLFMQKKHANKRGLKV